jgi:hypothetical protein
MTLANQPTTFAAAFRKAEDVPGRDIAEGPVSIAQLWLNDYGAGTSPDKAKIVANSLLGDAAALRSLSKKTRFQLTNQFFPSFDLPRGWRLVAQLGHITKDQIAALIMERLRMIDEGKLDVASQSAFIRTLLTRPRNIGESYRELMTQQQLKTVVEIVQRRAAAIYRETRAETIGWRIGPIR